MRWKAPLDTNPKLHEIPSSSFQYTTSMFFLFSLALRSNLVIQRCYHVHCNILKNIVVSQKYLCKYQTLQSLCSLVLWVLLKLYTVHNIHQNVQCQWYKPHERKDFFLSCVQSMMLSNSSHSINVYWMDAYFPLVPLTT